MRARHGARAPHQTEGSRLRPSMRVGGHDLRPKGRISGPNPTGFGSLNPPPALHRSAPPQDASRSAPHERGVRDLVLDRNVVKDYFHGIGWERIALVAHKTIDPLANRDCSPVTLRGSYSFR